MKKKFKSAFSLMELLLVMAIIAVILTMGFSLSKQGIEKAYNRYFYTGYVGLYEALSEVTIQGTAINNPNFITEINDLLEGQLVQATRTITAPNGISYTFNQPVNATLNAGSDTVDYLVVTMGVPSVNRGGLRNAARFAFSPNYQGGMLIPFSTPPLMANEINLQERIDLLPFYINTGTQGQVSVNDAGAGQMLENRDILSYRDAHCSRYGATSFDPDPAPILTIVNCNGVMNVNTVDTGFIQIADPNRVF